MSGRFNPNDYDTVDSRLHKFWDKHPEGRVLTEMVWRDEQRYIVHAAIYTDRQDDRPAATGFAEEIVGSTPVNKTSALENCETSAVGRALANLDFQTKARPTQTEMGKADRQQERNEPAEDSVADARSQLANLAKAKDVPIEKVAAAYQGLTKTDITKETDPARIRKFIAHLNAEGWKPVLEPAGA